MPQFKTYKFRIYPNKGQEVSFAKSFGAKRWIFNHFLHENKQRFFNKEKHLSNFDINKEITILKKQSETSWLKDIDDWCLKHSSEDLSNACTQFFNSVKGKRKGSKLQVPKFKNKYSKQSYRTRSIKVDVKSGFISVPKIKNIKCVYHRDFPQENIKSATISKTPSGKYFI